MKQYEKATISRLGKMAEVTKKSGPNFDLNRSNKPGGGGG